MPETKRVNLSILLGSLQMKHIWLSLDHDDILSNSYSKIWQYSSYT